MRIGSLITVALLATGGCRAKRDDDAKAHAEAPVGGDAPATANREAIARCGPAVEASRSNGLGALIAGCTPCGVPWTPLIALSGFDPDAPPPTSLPAPDAVLAVLDACKATCSGSTRTEVFEILGDAQMGKYPSKAWRKIAECTGALELDDRTRRYARGTWYAVTQIAKALWSADAPKEVAAARDLAPLDFPLPPFSEASTAMAVPRSDVLAPQPPRLQVTIDQGSVRIGALPFLRLAGGKATLAPAPGEDYPGTAVTLDELDHALAALVTASAAAPFSYDLSLAPVLIAPRGMPAKRLLEVLGRMPGSRAYLAGTPKSAVAGPWPEPVGAIPIFISTAPPFPDLPVLDTKDPAQLAAAIDALPSTASAVRVVLPADATVEQVGDALSGLAAHGVDRAALELNPTSP